MPNSTKITKEQVKHITKLANLDISGEEDKYAEILSDTLSYISNLEELDTKNVKKTYQVTNLASVYQKKDHPKTTLKQEEALSNVDGENGLFATEAVFER